MLTLYEIYMRAIKRGRHRRAVDLTSPKEEQKCGPTPGLSGVRGLWWWCPHGALPEASMGAEGRRRHQGRPLVDQAISGTLREEDREIP